MAATEPNTKSLPLSNTASTPLPEVSKGPQNMPLGETNDDKVQLVQGRTLSCNVAVGHKLPLYVAGSLESQLEYPVEEAAILPDNTPSDIRYGLEWIAIEEADSLYEDWAVSLIDVEELRDESTHELDDQNCLFIIARGVLMRIHLRPATSEFLDRQSL
jgi:hypothetical protein